MVDPGARWEPSRSPLRLAEEDAFVAAASTVAGSAEGGAGVESRAPAALARSSPAVGDVRSQPIVLSEESAEAMVATAQGERAPEALMVVVEGPVTGPPVRPAAVEESSGAAQSGDAGSALALALGGAGPSNALLEAMASAESWSQVVRGGGLGLCLDGAALDAAKSAIDTAKVQVDLYL